MRSLVVTCVLLFVPLMYSQDKMQEPAKDKHPAHHMAGSGDFKAEIQKNADDWAAAFKAKDADKVAAWYTDDAVWINPDGTFHGTGAIKAEVKKMLDRGDTVDTVTTIKAVRAGEIGYAEGTYSGKAPTGEGGAEQQAHGSWVVTLKNSNGKWMLATHTSVPGAHAPMAKGEKKMEKKPE